MGYQKCEDVGLLVLLNTSKPHAELLDDVCGVLQDLADKTSDSNGAAPVTLVSCRMPLLKSFP